jgi:hypothetical protein
MEEVKYDEKLWFFHKNCSGEHFLLGNPHTHPERMYAWCPAKKHCFCVSDSEIEGRSIEAEYWIKGFLSGNESRPEEE